MGPGGASADGNGIDYYFPRMTSIQTVLFDLDGTLIDSTRLILDSYHHTIAAHGMAPVAEAEWKRGMGTPLRVQLREWATSDEHLEAMVATYRGYNLANHDSMVVAYAGVDALLQSIRSSGKKIGIVTSKNREGTQRGLRIAGLENAVDLLVCADDVTNPKPHPEPVLRAVELLKADPATTIYVGDSIHDMRSGRGAGVLTAAVLWGPFAREELSPAEPDYWLERPGELLAVIGAED
jgi:pyrophosphatase PpaX